MHSSSKTTWPDRTSAAERGSVIDGSGRTGPSRPATATGGHIPVHMLSPQRSGRSPLGPPQLRACLDGLGRSPVSTTVAVFRRVAALSLSAMCCPAAAVTFGHLLSAAAGYPVAAVLGSRAL